VSLQQPLKTQSCSWVTTHTFRVCWQAGNHSVPGTIMILVAEHHKFCAKPYSLQIRAATNNDFSRDLIADQLLEMDCSDVHRRCCRRAASVCLHIVCASPATSMSLSSSGDLQAKKRCYKCSGPNVERQTAPARPCAGVLFYRL